jgi:hypothetical protein
MFLGQFWWDILAMASEKWVISPFSVLLEKQGRFLSFSYSQSGCFGSIGCGSASETPYEAFPKTSTGLFQ